MPKQKGAALIVVLSLLTISLMVGLSSMQSSQIDERLAGNYKASAEAQMNAEHAVSTLYADIKDPDKSVDKVPQDDVEGYDWGSDGLRWAVFKDFATSDSFEDSCLSSSVNQKKIACYMELPYNFQEEGLPSGDYIVAFGAIDDSGVAESQPVFAEIIFNPGGQFSATTLLGDLDDENGELQFPSSNGSELYGGSFESDGEVFDVGSFMMYSDSDNYDKETILEMGGDAGLESSNVGVYDMKKTDVYSSMMDSVAFLRNLYQDHVDAGGNQVSGGVCNGLCFYEDGMKETGNQTLEGVHVVLNGDAQVGGNADIQGVLIVLNLDVKKNKKGELDEDPYFVEEWKVVPSLELKLNGGGNKGTVWFDEGSVKSALDTVGVSLEEFFIGSGGSSGSPSINSWQ